MVIRNGLNGEISHTLFCIADGKKFYLSKPASDKMMEFGTEQINDYYSGAPEDEVDSLKEDIGDILMGETSAEVLKYKIALSIGFLNKEEDVIEIDL
jgi:hypothetical protein